MYVSDANNNNVRRVTITTASALPAPLAIGTLTLSPSLIGVADQLTAWRALAVAVDAQSLSFSAPLNANHTAGINPAVRTLALGNVVLTAQPGAGASDAHTFSTSARRGLHALTLTVAALPPYALALTALDTLNVAAPAC